MKLTKEKILWIIVILAVGMYVFPSIKNRVVFARTRPAAREAAPGFSLPDMNGKTVHLSDYRGQVVLVNFFAGWCPPCRMEIPGFEKIYAKYKTRGFTILGIAVDGVSPSFISDRGITYPVLSANDSVVDDYGNVTSIPQSFLIDKDGRIIKKVMGMYFENTLETDIEHALKGRS